ncbi:hypothetical protein [Aquimarina celericrescens]|uniref:Uncharacterized protein n=1 Tax=Aquimarina celericrescens TaxID=1964542 RepID=A0ABW5B0F8_9FLAO|nr:hypothetical protein [Aquimarina celericrescens]
MKKSILENLKPYQISKSVAKKVNGGDPLSDCIATAKRDGNEWLIDTCWEILGDHVA